MDKRTKVIANRNYYQTHRKVNWSARSCQFCKLEFIPKRATKLTCSDKCRKALSRAKKNEPKPLNFHYESDWIIGDDET